MSKTIESELHDLLVEIASDTHDVEEQAKIIAEAASIFHGASQRNSLRSASSATKVREAQMIDSLLQAMGALEDWNNETPEAEEYDNYSFAGLNSDQILHRIAYQSRHATKGFGDAMDILNDDDLLSLIDADYGDDYRIDDGEELHDYELFNTPGRGRHRSDSLAR